MLVREPKDTKLWISGSGGEVDLPWLLEEGVFGWHSNIGTWDGWSRPVAAPAIIQDRARLILEGERGFMKLVANAETGRLIGAALMCERATDMISQLTAAMANGLTVKQMLGFIRPHPTFEEALGAALEELAKKLEA